jgi:3-phosphoshikimate 1-carboxyvinyltransferase
MLTLVGADVAVEDGGLTIRVRPSPLRPFELDVPGDPSQAAFWVVAACLVPGSEVVVEDVYVGPARAGFLAVLARMGADVEVSGGKIRARYRDRLRATTVEPHEVPGLVDEVPILAVAAALADGVTRFAGVGELRVKESDRIEAIAAALAALDVGVAAGDNALAIEGRQRLTMPAEPVDTRGDHRMAMAMAVAALTLADREFLVVDDWSSVATSYPHFIADMEALCGS